MATSTFKPTREMIDAVAEWRQYQPKDRVNRPLVPHLRRRFKLSNAEAVAVIQASSRDAADQDFRKRLAALITGEGLPDATA